jgi:hypothetical protein
MTREYDAGDQAVLTYLGKAPRADRRLAAAWLSRGFEPLDALAQSGLLSGERRHPEQLPPDPFEARLRRLQEPLRDQLEREIAEHESAHCWTALARGLDVRDVSMGSDVGGGLTRFAEPDDLIDFGAVLSAGELWIDSFRRDQFPAGARGCTSDRRGILQRLNHLEIREAHRRAFGVLRQYAADILTLAEALREQRTIQLDSFYK